MLPDNQYQVDQESQPLAKTDIWTLNHAGLYARRPAVCIPLTLAHERARLNWSLKHQHWSMGEWANVMISDESRFSLTSDSRWVTIWRERETRFEQDIISRHNGKTSFPRHNGKTSFTRHNGKTSFSIKRSNGMGRHHDGRPYRPPFL
ncbi:transposable element Tcb2 transposase [Trichonephila clavipes]|nr:transposable element Tcb2 transposase [Trichonephila clavipes]